ncbi:DegT/DnrJ/EryC1/StrS family aminotransferase, partial [Shewanella sp. TB7-MNA-CIBAN-0143]
YLPSDIQAAYLFAQLEHAENILSERLNAWNYYSDELSCIEAIDLPIVPKDCIHNGHMFYIKVKSIKLRTELINFLKDNNVMAVFHYIPLH